MTDTFIIPSPSASASWEEVYDVPLELARSRQVQGRLFEKHILNEGTLIHPKTGERINVDSRFMDTLLTNFENGVADIVQVPVANDRNEHVESPAANIGEVVGLQRRDGKLYALIDARDEGAAAKLGRTYLGASAFLSTNYADTRTGRKAGPTLLHVAVTNRPYVVGLDDYKEITALSGTAGEPVVLMEEAGMPGYEDEVITGEDIVGAVVELSRRTAVLADQMGVPLIAAERLALTAEAGYADALTAEAGYADALIEAGYPVDGDAPVGFVSETDGAQLTQADLDGAAEDEVALAAGAASGYSDGRSEAETEDDKYGEVIRIAGQNYDDQLKSAGHRFTPPTWTELQAAAPQPADGADQACTRAGVPLAEYDYGVRLSHSELVADAVSERAEALGLSADSQDDRLVALADVVQRAGVPHLASSRDETESSRYFAASNGDAGAFGQGQSVDAAFGLARGGGLVTAAEKAHDPAIEYFRALARKLGINDMDAEDAQELKVQNAHGKPGSGRLVHRGLMAHASHLEAQYGGTDKGQPRKGGVGRVKPGRGVYPYAGLGGPEAPSGSAGKPVLSDRSGRVPSARDPYHPPAGKPQQILGATAGDGGGDYDQGGEEYYDGGSAEDILARHAGYL